MHRTRRTFLMDLGRTTAGLVVIGAGISACAETDPEVASSARPSGGASEGASGGAWTPTLVDLGFVAAYVLSRDGEAVVVDTGVPDSEAAILAVLEDLGLTWGDVGNVIATHSHPDHAGSLAAVAAAAGAAVLHGGAADIPAMTAPRTIVAVADGDVVAGLRIVTTPGHTPGHVSVLDPIGRFLITGDALVGVDGMLAGPDAQYTADMATAAMSVAKLAALDVDEVLVGHGFPVVGAGTAALAELSASL